MKKKFTGILVCLLMLCMSLFAGCNLVETDNFKMYNAVVAEIRNKDGVKVAEITNRELISGYQSYGAQQVQYYGKTKKEAVNMTLTQLENRKIAVITAEKNFGIDKTGKGLTSLEKTYLYETTVDTLKENLDSYYKEIVKTENEESNENDNVVFNGYEKNATLSTDENGNYIVVKEDKKDGLLEDYRPVGENRDYNNAEDKALIYENFIISLYNDDYKEAYEKYYKDLKSAEYGMKLSTNSKEVFEREIQRLYNINYENYMVEKFTESFVNSSNVSNITTNDILSLYSSKVRADYASYVLEKDSGYDTDVSDTLKDVYYFKNDDESTKYFTVANILFQFDEDQQETYNTKSAELEANKGKDGYDTILAEIESLYTQIEPLIRQYNEVTGEYEEIDNTNNLTVNDIIYDKIEIVLKNAQTTGSVNVIGDTINDLIYQYNEDPGMLNAEVPYVIGVNKEGKAVSNFVDEFNDAGLELYDNGNGQIGDMAIAKSQYGIHVLIYTGKCENLFDGINSSFNLVNASSESNEEGQKAIEILYRTRVNIMLDKTYFDVLYDELYNDNFTYFQTANANFLREDYEIKVYRGRIADSLKD